MGAHAHCCLTSTFYTFKVISGTLVSEMFYNKIKLCSGPASRERIVNVKTVDMQSSNKQEWNQITPKFRNVIYNKHFRWKKCLNTPQVKNDFFPLKRAQYRRCTSSICEQSLGKVWIKRNENFWSYRLHKLGTPKMLHMDGQMGKKSRFNTHQKWEKTMKHFHKIGDANLQCVNNHYAKFECKGMNTVGVKDYTN